MKKKNNALRRASWVSLFLGFGLIATSYFIFGSLTHPYLLSIQSELASAGIVLTIFSGAYLFFNTRLRG